MQYESSFMLMLKDLPPSGSLSRHAFILVDGITVCPNWGQAASAGDRVCPLNHVWNQGSAGCPWLQPDVPLPWCNHGVVDPHCWTDLGPRVMLSHILGATPWRGQVVKWLVRVEARRVPPVIDENLCTRYKSMHRWSGGWFSNFRSSIGCTMRLNSCFPKSTLYISQYHT